MTERDTKGGPIVHVIGELVAAGAEIFVYQLTQKFKSSWGCRGVTFYKATDIHPGDEKAAEVEREIRALKSRHHRAADWQTPRLITVLTWRTLKIGQKPLSHTLSIHIWKKYHFMSV